MAKLPESRNADTSPTKEVVVQGLTKDATVEACLFDLIDNSIDSAGTIAAGKGQSAAEGLPNSYQGFRIDVKIDPTVVTVQDNAAGISPDDLQKRVLRFGMRAGQPHGIGFYGVGLNRALFKLGSRVAIQTSDGKNSSTVKIDVEKYLGEPGWKQPFVVTSVRAPKGTTISIADSPPDIAHKLADPAWQEEFRSELGRRFHRFIEKGLHLTFQKKPVPAAYVHIREGSLFPPLRKSYKLGDVWVHIDAGEHSDHRFAAESADGKGVNPKELTRDFGWSVLCNDRLILEADRSEKTGWESTWHGEYNGFVGRVHFISPHPSALPWNTSKTDVDTTNPNYRKALEDMQAFAQTWRHFTRTAKNAKKRGAPIPIPANRPTASPIKPPARGAQSKAKPHERTVLSADINEVHCRGKLLDLVQEGKRVDFYDNRYTGLSLLRILFEQAAIHFLKRAGSLDNCLSWCIGSEEQARGKPFAVAFKKHYMPSLSTLLDYFTANWVGAMGASHATYLQKSFEQFKRYKEKLNDSIHHPFTVIDPFHAIEIRDSLLPLLRHLIET